jgi:hypothetical protein
LQLFSSCVNAENNDCDPRYCSCQGCREEEWAYNELKKLYHEHVRSDYQPGFLEAMQWAAETERIHAASDPR